MSKLIVSFEKDGKDLPVTSFKKSKGIEFGGEKLSRPRTVTVGYGWPSTSTARGKIVAMSSNNSPANAAESRM